MLNGLQGHVVTGLPLTSRIGGDVAVALSDAIAAATAVRPRVPGGNHTIRIFGTRWHAIAEFKLLAMVGNILHVHLYIYIYVQSTQDHKKQNCCYYIYIAFYMISNYIFICLY